MKKFFLILLAGLVVLAVTAPAFAWEFEVKGLYEYRLRYLARTGGTDLFGIASIQDAPGGTLGNAIPAPGTSTASRVGFAGPSFLQTGLATGILAPNTTSGAIRIVRGGYSPFESDALYNDQRMTFEPAFRVNPAIRVHGVYTVGGYRNKYAQGFATANVGVPPFERYMQIQSAENAYDTAAVGSWEQIRATIQLPIGLVSIGAKDFPLGTGATTSFATVSTSTLFVLPYGPLRMLPAVWLARNATFPTALDFTGGTGNSYSHSPDAGRKPTVFCGFLTTWDQGPLNFGGGIIWQQLHQNSAYTKPLLGITASTVGNAALDRNLMFWEWFLKYNNGRFMLAAEYSWVNVDWFWSGGPFPGVNQTPGPRYFEGYHLMLEAACVAGPSKVRLAWFQASGPSQIALTGSPIVNSSNNPTKVYFNYAINYQALEPYEFLMFNTYGGGNDTFTALLMPADGHGMLGDAYAFAGRLDYAVASNLNIYASYIWAHRLETNGTLRGSKLSNGAAATLDQANAWCLANGFPVATAFVQAGGSLIASTIPTYVDNGYLGWEANVGVEWKLLEGLNMFLRYSYWQPGDWFNQAYQAVAFRGGAPVGDGYLQGRSAIHAIQGSWMINF